MGFREFLIGLGIGAVAVNTAAEKTANAQEPISDNDSSPVEERSVNPQELQGPAGPLITVPSWETAPNTQSVDDTDGVNVQALLEQLMRGQSSEAQEGVPTGIPSWINADTFNNPEFTGDISTTPEFIQSVVNEKKLLPDGVSFTVDGINQQMTVTREDGVTNFLVLSLVVTNKGISVIGTEDTLSGRSRFISSSEISQFDLDIILGTLGAKDVSASFVRTHSQSDVFSVGSYGFGPDTGLIDPAYIQAWSDDQFGFTMMIFTETRASLSSNGEGLAVAAQTVRVAPHSDASASAPIFMKTVTDTGSEVQYYTFDVTSGSWTLLSDPASASQAENIIGLSGRSGDENDLRNLGRHVDVPQVTPETPPPAVPQSPDSQTSNLDE